MATVNSLKAHYGRDGSHLSNRGYGLMTSHEIDLASALFGITNPSTVPRTMYIQSSDNSIASSCNYSRSYYTKVHRLYLIFSRHTMNTRPVSRYQTSTISYTVSIASSSFSKRLPSGALIRQTIERGRDLNWQVAIGRNHFINMYGTPTDI